MQQQELSITLWFGGFMLTAIGILISAFGGIIVYIFSRHRDDNDSEHEYFDEITTRHDKEIVELRTEHNIYRGKCKHE